MGYELLGRLHAAITVAGRERGQGTVEYVGLILLLAVILGAVIGAGGKAKGIGEIPDAIITKLKDTIGDMKATGGK
jgi:hypothetical protein